MASTLDVSRLRGRSPWTMEDGRAVVAAWRASGRSLARFAEGHGLSADRIRWWGKRLGTAPRGEVRLVPVDVVSRAATAAGFEVVVGEHVVRVPATFEAAALKRLVEVLASC